MALVFHILSFAITVFLSVVVAIDRWMMDGLWFIQARFKMSESSQSSEEERKDGVARKPSFDLLVRVTAKLATSNHNIFFILIISYGISFRESTTHRWWYHWMNRKSTTMKLLGIANALFLLGFTARDTNAFSVANSQLSRSRHQQGAIGKALTLRQPPPHGHSRLSTDKYPRQSNTQLSALLEIVGTSAEPIHTAFSIINFFPQPFWLLLILLPKSKFTKNIMGGMGRSS